MLRQDDPKKCTAVKLVRFGLAKKIKKTTKNTLILDPFSQKVLLPNDKKRIHSVTAIDCSWNLASQTFTTKFEGLHRKLPPLFAGNPVNYSKVAKLTTVEAIAGSVFILGHKNLALRLLDKFSWGHTFYELNQDLLNDYARLDSEDQIYSILNDYEISINQ